MRRKSQEKREKNRKETKCKRCQEIVHMKLFAEQVSRWFWGKIGSECDDGMQPEVS